MLVPVPLERKNWLLHVLWAQHKALGDASHVHESNLLLFLAAPKSLEDAGKLMLIPNLWTIRGNMQQLEPCPVADSHLICCLSLSSARLAVDD